MPHVMPFHLLLPVRQEEEAATGCQGHARAGDAKAAQPHVMCLIVRWVK
jgi:hypothetical protein